MIEPDCAGCTSSQDTLSTSSLNQDYHQQKQQFPSSSSSPKFQTSNSNHQNFQKETLSTQPSSTSTIPLNLQSKLNYFQHNNIQPLFNSNQLLLASSTAGSAVAGPALQPFLGSSSHHSQFALTPDARACVTATYLCVLIVNNTWLDCNLLETLCNNQNQYANNGNKNNNDDTNGQTNSSSSNSSTSKQQQQVVDKRKQEEYQLAAALEATMKLNALEMALSELIAFANGGTTEKSPSYKSQNEDTTLSDSSAPDGVYRPLPVYFRPDEVVSSSTQLPMEPYVDKGGGSGGDEGSGEGEDESESDTDYDDASSDTSNKPLVDRIKARLRTAKQPPDGGSGGGYEQILTANNQAQRLASQQGSDSDSDDEQATDEKPSILEHYSNFPGQIQQQQVATGGRYPSTMTTTTTTTTTTMTTRQQVEGAQQPETMNKNETNEFSASPTLAPTNTHSSWTLGRPFRAWGYSFWPIGGGSGNGANNQHESVSVQEQQKQPQQQQVQILRPVESGQYNDIITNQSSFKQQSSAIGSQQKFSSHQVYQQTQHQNQLENSGIQGAMNPASGSTIQSTTIIDTNNNQPIFSGPTASQMTLQGSSSFNGNGGELVDNPETSGGFNQHQFSPPATPMRTSTTPITIYDPTNTALVSGSFAPANNAAIVANNLQQQQQQQATDRNHAHQHLTLSQQQYPPSQQFQTEDEFHQCKCTSNELIMNEQLTAEECRYRCLTPATTSTTPSMGAGQSEATPLATATTFAAPSTTLSPSAKMNPMDITFMLYTRSNRDQANADSLTNETSSLLHFNPNDMMTSGPRLNISLPIKIVIHGFGSGGRRPWVTDMVYKLLDYEDVNVIVVDWEKGATLPNYVQAAGNTRLVGHKIASLIKTINAKYGLTGNSYHLIGFSLGAHVAGFAGMEIRNSTNVARCWINRITGLDPASPLFEGYEANDRLDPSDAQFVDVIHSNGDGVLRGGFGSLQPMGHVDFYPNGGRVQVGCNSVLLSALSDIIYGKWQSLCNHRRALNFFMDSFEFNKCRFRSFNCDSYENYLKGECFDCGVNNEKCSYMGYLANYSKGRGKMYLTTHEDAPFCANQFIIKIVGTKGYKTHWGKVEVTLVTLNGKNESFWLSSTNQQSSGHELTSLGHQKELNSQQQHFMQSLIVAHPVLVNFTQVLLRYTKYKGWIYSGDESWSIDKIFITDSDGQVKSYCGYNTILESHITSTLNLEPGNCTVVEPISTGTGSGTQMLRGRENGSGNGRETNGMATSVSSSSQMPQQQQQQQQQSQTQTQTQSSQQQQPSSSQTARTPRLFTSRIQQSQQQNEPQTTPVAMSALGHSFQRMATERPSSQFTLNYNNIPFVTSF